MYTHMSAHKSQNRALGLRELETVVRHLKRVLGTELWPSRAWSTLTCWVSLPAPTLPFYNVMIVAGRGGNTFNLSTAGGSLNSGPAWSMERVPGQPGLFHRETLSQETKHKYGYFQRPSTTHSLSELLNFITIQNSLSASFLSSYLINSIPKIG